MKIKNLKEFIKELPDEADIIVDEDSKFKLSFKDNILKISSFNEDDEFDEDYSSSDDLDNSEDFSSDEELLGEMFYADLGD